MRKTKKGLTWCLAILLVLGLVFAGSQPAQAASPKLNYSKIWIQTGTNETLKISGVNKVKWSVTSGKSVVSLSSVKNTSVKVKGKQAGTAVITAKSGKKKWKCTVKVYKEAAGDSLHMGHYGDSFVKKNHVLYDANGKVICKDVLDVDGDGSRGFYVLKVNHTLYHYAATVTKSSRSYSCSKKILSGVKELTNGMGRAEGKYTYVLKSNGKVYRLTRKSKNGIYLNEFSVKEYMSGVAHVYCGYNWEGGNYFALKKDGSLWGWGTNTHGEMANGKTTKVTKPRQIMTDVKSFFVVDECWGMADYGNACFAVKKDGTLYGWGFNQGDIPGGDSESVTSPVKILDGIKTVRSGQSIITAIDTKGQLWLWGRYPTHTEGMTAYMTIFSPVVAATGVSYADSDTIGAYYIKTNGTLYRIPLRGGSTVETYIKSAQKVMTSVKTINANQGYILRKDGTLWKITVKNDKVSSKKKVMSGF